MLQKTHGANAAFPKAGGILTGDLTAPNVTTTGVVSDASGNVRAGRKNLLINGGMDVWQRGTSFTGAGYKADRWIVSTSDSGLTVTKTANRDKLNTLKITMVGVSCTLEQRIEAFGNVVYNKQFTVSFWVRGSGTFNSNLCRVRNHTTSTNIEDKTYDVTASWSRVSLTFAADSTWNKDDVCRLYVLNNTGRLV